MIRENIHMCNTPKHVYTRMWGICVYSVYSIAISLFGRKCYKPAMLSAMLRSLLSVENPFSPAKRFL